MMSLRKIVAVLLAVVLAGSMVTPAQASKKLSIDNISYTKIGKAAFAEVNSQLKGKKLITGRAVFIASPNVQKKELKTERDLVNKAVTIFSKWYLPESFKVVMFTEKDGQWADQALIEHGGSFPSKISDEIKKWSQGNGLCNFAFATMRRPGDSVYYGCTDSQRIRDWTNLQNPPHEYFHLVQQPYGRLPIWLHEGSATFFGAAIGHNKISSNGIASKNFYVQTAANFDPDNQGFDHTRFVRTLRSLTPEQSVKMFRDLEMANWERGHKLGHYALGALATEVLVGVWGLDKYMSMLKNAGYDSVNWKASFESTYGLTTDEFYAKLTPFLKTVGERSALR